MKRAPLAVLLLLLATIGCNLSRERRFDLSSSDEVTVTREMKEEVLATMRGWYWRERATSWRTVSEQPRDGKILHQETETQCPDRYHLRLTGAVDLERYIIGSDQYERRGNAPWQKSTAVQPVAQLAICRFSAHAPRRQPPDEAEIMAMPGLYSASVKVDKGPVREYQGIKCQEFTVHDADDLPMTNCFSLADAGQPTYRIRTQRGISWEIQYDFNKPLSIEAPTMK